MEEWRAVVGFEGWYEVSDCGQMRRIRRGPHTRPGLILKQGVHRTGYLQANLWRDGKVKRVYVGREVALAFLGIPPAGHEANHIDGVKTNNRLANLEWVSAVANLNHAYKTGLKKGVHQNNNGENNPRAKLTNVQAAEIRALKGTASRITIATQYDVSIHIVKAIWGGRTWQRV